MHLYLHEQYMDDNGFVILDTTCSFLFVFQSSILTWNIKCSFTRSVVKKVHFS